MKFWEAILKGAKMSKQHFGALWSGADGSCAVGAGILGLGFEHGSYPYLSEETRGKPYSLLMGLPPVMCPVAGCPGSGSVVPQSVVGQIAHLNDDHRWSRECIAYWLRDTVEEPKNIATDPVRPVSAPTEVPVPASSQTTQEPTLCGAPS